MTSEPKEIRDIEMLKEPFKGKLKKFLAYMEKVDPMKPHETLRTAKRQAWLVKNNKSWVAVSEHQLGNAADIHFVNPPHFPAPSNYRWRRAWEAAKKFGIQNGQDAWRTDGNHFYCDETLRLQFLDREDNKVLSKLGLNWHRADKAKRILENLRWFFIYGKNRNEIQKALDLIEEMKQSQHEIANEYKGT